MYYRLLGFIACTLAVLHTECSSQDLLKPGLAGMAPSKWITFRHTQASGAKYRSLHMDPQKYTQEDIYVRAWIPVVNKPGYTIVLGPHYRTEQLEMSRDGENPMHQMSDWKLRAMGVDMKSLFTLRNSAFLVLASQVNKSGSLANIAWKNVPVNYNFTAVYLKKKSSNKEIGLGFSVSKSNNLTVLPVVVFNYNYASNAGFEISLPKKIAWRYNISPKDIFYLKSEAVTRSYYTAGLNDEVGIFRKIDVDTGILYNRQINKLIGLEIFGGYRKNISSRLPEGIIPIKTSGLTGSIELYIRPPFGLAKKK
jgi:hypothetical protein